MAIANKSTIRTQVLSAVGNSSHISSSDVDTMLEANNAEIVESFSWHRRIAWTIVNTIAPATLTVGVTQDDATVTGTFTSAMVGRLIRIGDEGAFYRIASVVASTSCELGDSQGNAIVYPGSTDTSVSATIFKDTYSLQADAEVVRGAFSTSPLREMDPLLMDSLDSQRVSTADPPTNWANYGRDSSGYLQIRFFPVPSDALSIRVEYKRSGTISSDSDSPLYPAAVLKWMTAAAACGFLFARTNDAAWATLGDKYMQWYEKCFERAKEDDLLKASLPTAINTDENIGLSSDEFLLSRDVWSPSGGY